MGKDLVTVTLSREDSNESWGFRLAGGKGTGQPLTISQVYSRLAGAHHLPGILQTSWSSPSPRYTPD